MSKRQAFLKYILSINITILILGVIALLYIDKNTAQYFVLILTMFMNTVFGLVVITVIYRVGSRCKGKK